MLLRVHRMAAFPTMGWLLMYLETFTAPRYTEAKTTTDVSTSLRLERVDGQLEVHNCREFDVSKAGWNCGI